MNSKFKILIHIGYPKTGTTFLQRFILNNLKNANYLGIGNKFDKDLYFIRKSVIYDSDSKFNKKITFLRKIIRKKIKKNTINIYSDEHYLIPTTIGYERNIKRIKKLFLEYKNKIFIILFTRKHSELISSLYKETSLIKKILKIKYFNEFLVRLEKKKLNKIDKIFLSHFDFLKIIKVLKKEVTKNIKVYHFNDFVINKNKFIIKFLNSNKLKIKNINTYVINENSTKSEIIQTKHQIKSLRNNRIAIIFLNFLNKFLNTKIKFYIKDKIIMFLFKKKEQIKINKFYLIDEYFENKSHFK